MTLQNGKYWDVSFNPLRGCTHCSPGCDNCWAEDVDKRFNGGKDFDGTGPHFYPEVLDKLEHWKKPRKVFVCDMSDAFYWGVGSAVTENHLHQWEVFCAMKAHPRHQYLLLTKRAENMAYWSERWQGWWGGTPDNWWLGGTCENQEWADKRIQHLLQRRSTGLCWASFEPLLDSVILDRRHLYCPTHDFNGGFYCGSCRDMRRLDWIVIGCESGPRRRPCKLEWVDSLIRQGKKMGIPVWVKQIEVKGKIIKGLNQISNILGYPAESLRQWPEKRQP